MSVCRINTLFVFVFSKNCAYAVWPQQNFFELCNFPWQNLSTDLRLWSQPQKVLQLSDVLSDALSDARSGSLSDAFTARADCRLLAIRPASCGCAARVCRRLYAQICVCVCVWGCMRAYVCVSICECVCQMYLPGIANAKATHTTQLAQTSQSC